YPGLGSPSHAGQCPVSVVLRVLAVEGTKEHSDLATQIRGVDYDKVPSPITIGIRPPNSPGTPRIVHTLWCGRGDAYPLPSTLITQVENLGVAVGVNICLDERHHDII